MTAEIDARTPTHDRELATALPPVVFVSSRLQSRWPELAGDAEPPPLARFPSTRFLVLEDIWIVSTYIRLRNAGLPVRVSMRPEAGAVNVVCMPQVLREAGPGTGPIVAIRADRPATHWGDLVLAQNAAGLRRHHEWLIDHWPQPNLIHRNEARGTRVERIGVFGPLSSIFAPIQDSRFRAELQRHGFELVLRTDGADWNDYSDIDVQLAFRSPPRRELATKPATKLVQSWIAGVPAITGFEPCFRTVGRAGIDYLEARTPGEAIALIERLASDPDRYRDIVARGRMRSALHDESSVLRQWIAFLSGPAKTCLESGCYRGRRWTGRIAIRSRVAGFRLRNLVYRESSRIYRRMQTSQRFHPER